MEGLGVTRSAFNDCFDQCYRGRRALITGHTGFKGSWLALWLQELGAEVYGLALPAETKPNHALLLGLTGGLAGETLVDLRDAEATRRALVGFAPEIVFHLAAQSLVRHSYREPAATFGVNLMGLVNMLEAVRATPSVRAVLVATSDKCYENQATGQAFREQDALGGSDPYSASKACAEIIAASYRASFFSADDGRGHPVGLATARAGNVIGGGDWAAERLLPDLVRAALAGRPTLIRQPHSVRPWQHVLEPLAGYLQVGQGLLAGAAEFAEAWNFGPDAAGHLSVGELVERCAQIWPEVRREQSSGPIDPMHEAALLRLDCSKAKQRLAWRSVWDCDTLLRRSLAWYRAQAENGVLNSHADLQQYHQDALALGVPWAG